MKQFESILDFVAHLGVLAAELHEAEHAGLERGAQIIEDEAKAEIGVYQDAAGQFAAWPALAESTQAGRQALGFSADEPLLRTGELRESIKHEVQGREAQIGSDLEVALYQELGTSRIPARSFLGGAAFRKGHEAAEAIGGEVVGTLIGARLPPLSIR